MKPSLQLKVSQYLTLTPQLQQSIRLLQLSTIELNKDIEKYLIENPFLDREDGAAEAPAGEVEVGREAGGAGDEPAPQSDVTSSETSSSNEAEIDLWEESYASANRDSRDDDDDRDFTQQEASEQSLRQHLLWQTNLLNLSERDRNIVAMLIDALDDDGYLTQSLEDLAAILPPELELEADELAIGLKHLQHLDPIGVGARDLAECLILQLDALPPEMPFRQLARDIVSHHLNAIAAHDYNKLRKALHCEEAALRDAQKLIKRLNPRPCAPFATSETRYVVPDVVVRKLKNLWSVSLNPDAMPRLRINRLYADMLRRRKAESNNELNSQLQEARWLIKNVKQRFDTILRVSQAIVDRQRNFFEHGEVAMKPLVLHEIAEILDLHESTISRATTQKFMLTPRGIFELKYFFGSHVSTDTGGACSATAIRALIKQMVGGEDAASPLSDRQISKALNNQGIVVARRTIAKYRESLNIPPVNLRRSI